MTLSERSPPRVGRSYYDESKYFAAGTHLHDFSSRFQRYRVRKILELHTPGPKDRVLDLGCGWGVMSFALAPGVSEMVGLDFSRRAVSTCEARLDGLGLDNVLFRCADARETGLRAPRRHHPAAGPIASASRR